MNWLDRLLQTFFLLLLWQVIVASNSFVSKPPATVVGVYGTSITFQWKITSSFIYRSWKYQRNGGTLYVIIAKVNHINATYEQADISLEYKNRITFPVGSTELTLQNLTFSDIGEYKCEVLQTDGQFRNSTQLKVYAYPTFGSSLPATVKTVEYKNVNFTCNVTSTPALNNITWSHSGKEISYNEKRTQTIVQSKNGMVASTASTLMLRNVTRQEKGEYECIAIHYFGYFNKSATLAVYSLPILTRFPKKDILTAEHSPHVKISCEATGYPLPTIVWYKDHELVNKLDVHYNVDSYNSTYNVSGEKFVNSTLTIRNITTNDFGYYTCKASNVLYELGEKNVNNSVHLLVRYESRFISPPLPRIYNVDNGSHIVLNCTVHAYPPLEVSWTSTVPSDSRFSLKTTTLLSNKVNTVIETLLIIENILIQDYGVYTCVSNNANLTKSWNTTISIRYSPQFYTHPPAHQVVQEFSLFYLECSIHSYPMSQIEWFYVIDNVTRFNLTDNSIVEVLKPMYRYENHLKSRLLFNRGISRNNNGVYVCSVRNTLSTEEAYTDIKVEWQPEFHSSSISGSMDLKKGLNTTLSCLVYSNPPADVGWEHNLLVLNATTFSIISSNSTLTVMSSILILTNVTLEDSGVYSCIANNSVGGIFKQSRRSIILTVLYSPILMVNSTQQNITTNANGFAISCEAKAYPAVTQYKWTKDGVDMYHNTSVFRVTVVNITYQGTYRCTPENAEGAGGTVTHVITVLVSPGITVPATCLPDQGMLYCSCAGVGNPPIDIFWTKTPSNAILSNTNTMNMSINLNVSGTYVCHLKNINGETKTSHQVTALVVGRTAQLYWHKDWYIIFWVLIPIIVILILICILWLARRHRNANKAVFVSSNRNTADVPPSIRNIQTRPDIYLPNRPTSFSAINNGYVEEEREKTDKEAMEVIMYLTEDFTNSSIWFSPPHESLDDKNENKEHIAQEGTEAPPHEQNDYDDLYEYMGAIAMNNNQNDSAQKDDRPHHDDQMGSLTDDMEGSSIYI